jgi:hypothetical protein
MNAIDRVTVLYQPFLNKGRGAFVIISNQYFHGFGVANFDIGISC